MSDRSENKFTGFLSGKGFYVVLAFCLAGAGTAAYLAMETSTGDATVQPPAQSSTITRQHSAADEWNFPQLEEAAGKQDGVKIESSQPSSSSSKVQSSSSQPAERSTGSGQSGVPASSAKLSLTMPIEGEVFTPYSNGELVKSETLGDWRTHNGVDIAAEQGAAVKAAAKGKVTAVRSDALWGYVVEITHSNGVVTNYCGLAKQLSVKEGDSVKLGQVVGLVGYIPAESLMPSHLHFECKQNGKFIDPMSVMSKK
ncbi:peptidoglycan DD-metalloendopeptidase family protein [Oscillospiraceae bacterium LTW-04]|nr:M23 family metallopeptidase [Oscillospiraceae bacterium MB24-C1]